MSYKALLILITAKFYNYNLIHHLQSFYYFDQIILLEYWSFNHALLIFAIFIPLNH
jgi:hypothetical protein